MAINLQQPLGTDIYSITVFNSNAQIIQDAVNGLLTDVDEINQILPNKYPFTYITSTSTNIDATNLTDGIYYLTVQPAGTLPQNISSTNNILIVSKVGSSLSEYLLTADGKLFHRVVSSSVGNWSIMTVQIVDNLTTEEADVALSANQGYILNKNKLNLVLLASTSSNQINLDNADSGIYICDGTTVSGTIPDFISISSTTATDNHFIFESYGTIGETTVLQRISDSVTTAQGTRIGYINSSSTWTWSAWTAYGSGGGGGGNTILLELVDLD